MKTFIIALSLISNTLFASTLQIHAPHVMARAAYTSADFNESIPFWIWKGQLIDLKKANEVIRDPSELICSFWMMDWTEEKTLTKENLKSKLLFESNQLDLWKRINSKALFTDKSLDAALTYTCVQKNLSGEIREVDFIEESLFNDVFQGLAEIIE